MAINNSTGLIVSGDLSSTLDTMRLTEEQVTSFNQSLIVAREGTQRWSEELGSAEGTVNRYAASLAGLGDKVRGLGGIVGGFSFSSIADAVSPAAIVGVLADIVGNFSEAANQADIYSKALGVNIEELTAWQYAAEAAGIQQGKLASIMGGITKNIGDALENPSSTAAQSLAALNVSAEKLVGLSPDKQLLEIAKQLNNVGTEGERVQIMESLASGASSLLPLLENNAEGLMRLTAEARALGVTIDSEAAASANEFQTNLRQLSAVGTSLQQEIAMDLLPGINEVGSAMVQAAKDGGPLLALWVGLGGVMSQMVYGTELEQAADDVKTLEERLNTLSFRQSNYEKGEGGWLGNFIRNWTYGSPEELQEEFDKTESMLAAAKERLEAMKGSFQIPQSGQVDAGAGNTGGTIDDLTVSLVKIQDPLAGYLRQLKQESHLIGKGTEERAALQAQWKLEEDARKALAQAEKAEAEGKKALAQQYRDQSEELQNAIPMVAELAAANVKDAEAQELAAAAKEKALQAQKALESAYANEIKALSDQHAKLTLSEREYYKYTLVVRGFEQAQIDAEMALWDTNKAIKDQADAAEEASKAAEKAAEQMKREQESIANTLTDALMSGFEGGKDFAASFVDTLKDLFKRLVLRPLIQPIASAGAAGITSLLAPAGATAGGGAGSGGVDLLSMASNALGFNPLSMATTGLGYASTMAGSMAAGAGAGQAAMLAAQTAEFGLSGAMLTTEALATAAPAAGGFWSTIAPFAPYALLALPFLTGVFKKKPSDKAQWGGIDLSDLSTFNVGGQTGEKFSQENADARDTVLAGFGQFAGTLGSVIGEELDGEINVHLGNRDGLRIGFDGVNHPDEMQNYGQDSEAFQQAGYDYIWDKFLATADHFGESILTLLSGLTDPNERQAGAVAFNSLQGIIDSDVAADYAAGVEAANRTLWDVGKEQYDQVMELTAAYDGSIEATQELAAATAARYQTELQLLAQIDAAINSTNALFASSREQFYLAGLDDQQTYNYWKDKADSASLDLTTMVDPAEIQQTVHDINRYYMAAWGTLTPEQQAQMSGQYLGYMNDLEGLRDERLTASRNQIIGESDTIALSVNQAIIDAADKFIQAADRISGAADTINDAADKPVQVAVAVEQPTWNDPMGELGD